MQIPTLERKAFGQPTATQVTVGDLRIVFSYDTPVAFKQGHDDWVVAANVWSNTTNRTLNAIHGAGWTSQAARLPVAEFNERLAAASAATS